MSLLDLLSEGLLILTDDGDAANRKTWEIKRSNIFYRLAAEFMTGPPLDNPKQGLGRIGPSGDTTF